MASDSFITISPSSGTGTQTLTITADPNTGRSQRSIVFGATGPNSLVSENRLSVTQQAAASSVSIPENTKTITATTPSTVFTGKSNLALLKVSNLTTNATVTAAVINGVTLDSTARGQLTSTGYTVPGDPGSDAAYNISITISTPENETASQIDYSGTVGDGTTNTTVTIHKQGTQVTGTLEFTSTRQGDYSSGDIVLTLNASGNAYSDGLPRTIKLEADPNTISWSISPES